MDETILQQIQNEIDNARLNRDRANLSRQQLDTFLDKEEKSMVDSQLDLSDQITRIDYLLKGYSLQPDEQGNLVWTAPVSEDMKVFSDYGIQLVMNTICFYLNKNTLLSNFSEEEIRQKMLEFTKELIWAVFMNYDKVFKYPSVEECIVMIKARLAKQTSITKYAYELQGRTDITAEQIYAQKIAQIEDKIELEIEKGKQSLIKEKLKRFPLLVRVIQDTVHSTYQRALNGQERESIRTHMSISETKGNVPLQYPKQGGFLGWGKK
jgi:hypothetical protein